MRLQTHFELIGVVVGVVGVVILVVYTFILGTRFW